MEHPGVFLSYSLLSRAWDRAGFSVLLKDDLIQNGFTEKGGEEEGGKHFICMGRLLWEHSLV